MIPRLKLPTGAVREETDAEFIARLQALLQRGVQIAEAVAAYDNPKCQPCPTCKSIARDFLDTLKGQGG